MDPRYHQRRGNPRTWHGQMAENFPNVIKDSFTINAASFNNFTRQDINNFCLQCFRIQTSIFDEQDENILPIGIMVPYYLIESTNFAQSLLHHVTLSSVMCRINNTELPVIAVIHLDRSVLRNNEYIQNIITSIGTTGVEGVAIWVDDFNENNTTIVEAENLKNLYQGLSEYDKSTIAMYAGIGQIILMKTGLNSICHGTHYQMDRTAFKEGGGPAHFFYLPPLRKRIQIIDAQAFIGRQNIRNSTDYSTKICSCQVCETHIAPGPDYLEIIGSLEANTNKVVEVVAGHFTACKQDEINNVLNLTIDQLRSVLINKPLEDLDLTQDEIDHLNDNLADVWLSVIS